MELKNSQNSAVLEALFIQFKRYPHFLIIGGLGYGISIGLTFLFTEYMRLWYLLSFIIAALVSLTVSFMLNSAFTFKGYLRKSHSRRYSLYIGFYAVSALVTFTLVYLLTSVFGIHYLISITAVTLISSFITFIVNKKLIFIHK